MRGVIKELIVNYGPHVISAYVKESSVALCWRKCGQIGDHRHFLGGLAKDSRILEKC